VIGDDPSDAKRGTWLLSLFFLVTPLGRSDLRQGDFSGGHSRVNRQGAQARNSCLRWPIADLALRLCRFDLRKCLILMVGATGIEPVTPTMSTQESLMIKRN